MGKGGHFDEIFDVDKFKSWGMRFVNGWQGCRGIGIGIGCVEQKLHKFEIRGLFIFEGELWAKLKGG